MNSRSVLPIGITLWFMFSAMFLVLCSAPGTVHYAVKAAFVVEGVLDLVAVMLCFSLWMKATKEAKSMFFWFMASFIFLFLSDFLYFSTHVLEFFHIAYANLFELFLIIFLACQAIAWSQWIKASSRESDDVSGIVNVLAFLSVIVVLGVFFFGLHWTFSYLSSTGSYYTIGSILEAIIYVLIMLALVRMACPFTKMIAIGMLILVVSIFVMNSRFVASGPDIDLMMQTTWILGVWLMVLGFWQQKKALY